MGRLGAADEARGRAAYGLVPERASLSTACVQRHSRPPGRGVSGCPLYAVARAIVGSCSLVIPSGGEESLSSRSRGLTAGTIAIPPSLGMTAVPVPGSQCLQ